MERILPPLHRGAAAQVMVEHYFVLQYWCGAVALGHLLLEWLYAGKSLQRWILYWIVGILVLGLSCGLLIEPKLKGLHLEIYGARSTPEQRQRAGTAFRFWQGVVQLSNLVVVSGLWVYLWHISSPGTSGRFVAGSKFRG